MEGARTRGHGPALAAVEAMVRGAPPQALILSGPAGVGKTTLALDLAAGLLCQAPDPGARPCRVCRGCRMVDHGSHPDLHRLIPVGPGGQVVIGGPETDRRGVRDLVADLSLMPLEGGARVAIIEAAHRMTDDAQAALLKTLEEPPSGVTIVLCADDDSRLLATVRSRCARLQLGAVGSRAIEGILAERGAADAPAAARLARLATGRPGLALAYALSADAARLHGELTRMFLDLVEAAPAIRLASIRSAIGVGMDLVIALEEGSAAAHGLDEVAPNAGRASKRGRSAKGHAAAAPADAPPEPGTDEDADGGAMVPDADAPARAVPAAQRRRAAELLIGVAIDVARDLALIAAGGEASVRSIELLEESTAVAAMLHGGEATGILLRAERAAMLVSANVSPELVLDDLVLAWPSRRRVA